jgi:hypothetical protein
MDAKDSVFLNCAELMNDKFLAEKLTVVPDGHITHSI